MLGKMLGPSPPGIQCRDILSAVQHGRHALRSGHVGMLVTNRGVHCMEKLPYREVNTPPARHNLICSKICVYRPDRRASF